MFRLYTVNKLLDFPFLLYYFVKLIFVRCILYNLTKCIIRYNIVCFRKYIGQIYTDSLVHDEKALKLLVDTIGQVTSTVTFGYDLFKTL